MNLCNILSFAILHHWDVFLVFTVSLLAIFFVWKFRGKYPRTILVIFTLTVLIAGSATGYKKAQSQLQAGPGLVFSGVGSGQEPFDFAQLQRPSGTYFASGDIGVGTDQQMRVRDNAINSGNIKDKSVKNKDIGSGAINSRTIKNGTISGQDINADMADGFLKNTGGSLSWNQLSMEDIPIPTVGNPSVMDELQTAFDYIWSAGVLSGGNITDNGNGSVNVSSGEAMLRTSASQTAPLISIGFPGRNDIPMVNNTTNYLWVNYHGGDPQVETSTSVNDFNCLDKCHLYTIVREDTELYILDGRFQNVDANRKLRRKNYDTMPLAHVTGGSNLGYNVNYLTVSSGAFYYSLQKIPHGTFDTSLAGTSADRIFDAHYRDGSGGWRHLEGQKQVDNQHYDDGSGTLAIVPDGLYAVHWVYLIIGQVPQLVTVYGRDVCASIDDAKKEAAPNDVPPSISGAGTLIGRVIISKGGNIQSAESAFSSNFTGGTGGAVSHSSLTDLNADDHTQYALLAGRSTGQILIGGTDPNAMLTIQGTSAAGNTATDPNLIFNVGNAGGTQALTILNNGNIGIGTANPGIYKLYVNGAGYLNDTSWTYASDRRLKENIVPLDNSLAVIQKLNPVQFDYIDGRKDQFGFIAQDVQTVLPNLVEKRPDGMLGLRTDSLLPVAINAIQEQQAEIEALQNGSNAAPTSTDAARVGSATIKKGDTSIEVKTKAATKDSKIFLTITSKLTAPATLMATKIKDRESFTVESVDPLAEDVDFNWWIVNVN